MAGFSNYLLLLFVLFLLVETSVGYVCKTDYCTSQGCTTDQNCLKQNTSRVIKGGVKCGCCDLCVTQIPEGGSCVTTTDSIPNSECGPQLKCDPTTKVCVKQNNTECTSSQVEYDTRRSEGLLMVGTHRPKCDYLGFYDPVQCISGSVCFCISKNGERIFGTDAELTESKMLCNCSRDAYDLKTALKTSNSISYGVPDYSRMPPFAHCLPNGNYDPLQCIGDNCYCLNKNLKLQGKITSLSVKETLICYNPSYHDESYYRPCEIARNYILEVSQNATLYNTDIVGLDIPECDLDGSYAPVQCTGNMCYCVMKNGTKIEGYEAVRYSEDAVNMNCHCVRDRIFIRDPSLQVQTCCLSNGNYSPLQCQGSLCFCVDQRNGLQLADEDNEVPRKSVQNLPCYNETLIEICSRQYQPIPISM